jgi:ammonia channel protein AmtB
LFYFQRTPRPCPVGGTVVHLNAGIAVLVGAYVIGRGRTSRPTICRRR